MSLADSESMFGSRKTCPSKSAGRLYSECVDVLLESWRESKKVLESPVTAKEGRRVLQPAAYWLHAEVGRTRATAAELEPVIGPALEAIRWHGGTADTAGTAGSASKFLERLRDESGLLTGWDQERYGFMHLGFQEYLAAHEIRRLHFQGEDALRKLARSHGESWWQEVALLLVSLDRRSPYGVISTVPAR